MPRGEKSSNPGKPKREWLPIEDRYRKHGPASKRAERLAWAMMKKHHDDEDREIH